MDALMRMQNSFDIAQARKREGEIKVDRYRPTSEGKRGVRQRGGKSRMFHLNDDTASTVREVLVRSVTRDSTL